MADATTTDPKLAVWKCKTCGCLWRDNLDESVSLLDAEQKSCAICEKSPTNAACAIHWIPVKAALLSASQPSAPVDRQAVRHYLTCHQCEKKVSTLFTPEPTKTPDGGLIVRAWIECPECIEKDVAESEAEVTALHAERDRLKAAAWKAGQETDR